MCVIKECVAGVWTNCVFDVFLKYVLEVQMSKKYVLQKASLSFKLKTLDIKLTPKDT